LEECIKNSSQRKNLIENKILDIKKMKNPRKMQLIFKSNYLIINFQFIEESIYYTKLRELKYGNLDEYKKIPAGGALIEVQIGSSKKKSIWEILTKLFRNYYKFKKNKNIKTMKFKKV
jgi:hypothetical protein